MALREQDRHFLSSLYAAVAVIFTWKGLWEGIYVLPVVGDYLGDPFVFLFLGLAMLTLSGLIFREFDPLGSVEKAERRVLQKVFHHPQKKEFSVKYLDKKLKKEVLVPAARLRSLEKGALVVVFPGKLRETFIPLHRITEVLQRGKRYWRL